MSDFKPPFIRDYYLNSLLKNARKTKEGYPIIEKEMLFNSKPTNLVQWNRRNDCIGKEKETTICFYCNDEDFNALLSQPLKYLEKLKNYEAVVGLDASPYDNMSIIQQKSQIYDSLVVTYLLGREGIKIIPNIRLGSDETISFLEAIPKNCVISIGVNGFYKKNYDRKQLIRQGKKVIDILKPKAICIYGYEIMELEEYARLNNVEIYRYNSFTMNRNLYQKSSKIEVEFK